VGIPTSRNLDTLEELKSQISITELSHSTELDFRKLRRTQMDSDRASVLELLRGLLTNREVLQPSEPPSLSTLQRLNLGALSEAKPHFLHTFCQEEHMGIYRGVKLVL
jgi:hypothetical protein